MLTQFDRVLIIDSSGWKLNPKLQEQFRGTGGSGILAGIKLQFAFDFVSSTFAHFELTNGTTPDQRYANNIPSWLRKRDLILFDLGYFNLDVLNEIAALGTYFVCRYFNPTTIFIKKGDSFECLDLFLLLRTLKTRALFDIDVYLGGKTKIPCRLTVVQLSQEQRSKKLRKLNENAYQKGRTLSRDARFLASYNIYVTNVPRNVLSPSEVSQIYRLRWNIELLFKQFKSTMKLHVWNHGNEFRLRCEILGTLIIAAIIMAFHGIVQAMNIQNSNTEISFEKVFKLFKNNAYEILEAVTLPLKRLRRFVRNFFNLIFDNCRKESRTTRPSTLQALETQKTKRRTNVSKKVLISCVV